MAKRTLDDTDGTRRALALAAARAEFAEARAERMLRDFADAAAEIRLAPTDQAMRDRHAFRTRTLLDVERTLQGDCSDEVELGAVFEGWATRAMIASALVIELRSSTACVLVPGDVCRWVLTVAAELIHAHEAAADPERGCRLSVTIDHREAGLVMRVASLGGSARPVPSHSGFAALDRAGRVMRFLGELRQGVDGSDVAYVATFAGRVASPAL